MTNVVNVAIGILQECVNICDGDRIFTPDGDIKTFDKVTREGALGIRNHITWLLSLAQVDIEVVPLMGKRDSFVTRWLITPSIPLHEESEIDNPKEMYILLSEDGDGNLRSFEGVYRGRKETLSVAMKIIEKKVEVGQCPKELTQGIVCFNSENSRIGYYYGHKDTGEFSLKLKHKFAELFSVEVLKPRAVSPTEGED
jgi:hypothetical protein